MLRVPVDLVLPRSTTADVRRRAASVPRRGPREVRVRARGDALVARRWVHGPYATGHSVLRARLQDVPDGVLVRGAVAPSGLDLAMVVTWFAAAAGVAALGIAGENGTALAVALVPLAFGAVFASWLPRAVRDGHDVLCRALLADLGGPS